MILIHCLLFIIILSVANSVVNAPPKFHRRTGKECQVDADCITNAYCYAGRICTCKDRFVAANPSKNITICINEAEFIEEPCHYDLQCTGPLGIHAECKKFRSERTHDDEPGRCECKTDSHFQDGICYKNSRIGEHCIGNDNCVILNPNLTAYCDESRCICPPFYHANNNGTDCLHSSELGGPCYNDEDCIILNSRCLNVCACAIDYVMNQKKSECLKAATNLHEPCDEEQQCTKFLPNTTCDTLKKRRCICAPGFHEINGFCYHNSRLHEPCTQKEECAINVNSLSGVICDKGFCVCDKDYDTINRTYCISTKRILPDTEGGSTYFTINSLLFVNSLLLLFYCQW